MTARQDAIAVAAYLNRVGVKTPDELNKLALRAGLEGLGKVKALASGRPGPRAITGDYRRSWNVEMVYFAGGVRVIIGTNAAQARRLEYGFSGTDSLGRHYDQPAFPHARPMGNWLEARLARQADVVVERVLEAA